MREMHKSIHHPQRKLVSMLPFLSFVALLLLSSTLGSASNGTSFTLEVIHRDSIHSPLYPGNLSATERIRRHVKLSKIRLQQLMVRENGIRPVIDHAGLAYIVKIGIGSPPVQQYLQLDTAGELVWVQCHPCDPCFWQNPPFYKPASSSTYRHVPCNNLLCGPFVCRNGTCHYEIRYVDETFTRGAISTEHFTFATSRRESTEVLEGLVFGCSQKCSKLMFKKRVHRIAGVLGMNRGPKSFATQVAFRMPGRRFSYCLVPDSQRRISYLRFGVEVAESPYQQRTPFLATNTSLYYYYLGLEDLSFNHQKLNLPPGTFKINPDMTGGCALDSAVDVTFLTDHAFESVKSILTSYFASHNVTPIDGSRYDLELCYKTPRGFEAYPTMTFHFQGADLHLEPMNLFQFIHRKHHICAVFVKASRTLLGSKLQQNTRFVYDLAREEVRFSRENCAKH